VPRRVSLPGADELFRTTGGTSLTPAPRAPDSLQNREAREAREAGTQLRESREGQPDDPAGEHGAATAEPSASAAAQQAAGQFGTVARNGATHNGAARNGAQVPAARSAAQPSSSAEEPARRKPRGGGRSRPTGRERHEEKITVYVSAEELIDLEHARLVLRGEHGLAVDRGRIVREAVAVVLADLEQRGEASILVRRLRGR
jgi:hypothetical protein